MLRPGLHQPRRSGLAGRLEARHPSRRVHGRTLLDKQSATTGVVHRRTSRGTHHRARIVADQPRAGRRGLFRIAAAVERGRSAGARSHVCRVQAAGQGMAGSDPIGRVFPRRRLLVAGDESEVQPAPGTGSFGARLADPAIRRAGAGNPVVTPEELATGPPGAGHSRRLTPRRTPSRNQTFSDPSVTRPAPRPAERSRRPVPKTTSRWPSRRTGRSRPGPPAGRLNYAIPAAAIRSHTRSSPRPARSRASRSTRQASHSSPQALRNAPSNCGSPTRSSRQEQHSLPNKAPPPPPRSTPTARACSS
jgi:hypothetical protein